MSTDALIGYELPDGTIKAITLNRDGYISGAGRTLYEYYDLYKLKELCELGSIADLNISANTSTAYIRDRGEPEEYNSARIYESREKFIQGISVEPTISGYPRNYAYLLVDNEWFVDDWNVPSYQFVKLEDVLAQQGIECNRYSPNDEPETIEARDYILELVNEGVVDPMDMIKLLLDYSNNKTLTELVQKEFEEDNIPQEWLEGIVGDEI